MKKIRIGAGAGYGGDRIEPAVELVEKGNIDYLVYECLAERTIAIAQQAKMKDPNKGYNALLRDRMESVLASCYQNDITIITNMGAANPLAAVGLIQDIAEEKCLSGLKIAAVIGDDITKNIDKYLDYKLLNLNKKLSELKGKIISANTYLGIEGILEALQKDVDVVVTGRVSDPALFLAPLVYEFDWDRSNYELLGKGTVIGHLMECAGQITGGYFIEPGYKDVPAPWNLGFPIAEVSENGEAVITKVKNSGGAVTTASCKEQILYEIHDPSTYITPDCVADFTGVEFTEEGPNLIRVTGGTGSKEPEKLKVSIGYQDSFVGEGEISYGGTGALERAKLAKEIVGKRLEIANVSFQEIRYDFIGVNSLYKDKISDKITRSEPAEVRLRVAGRTSQRKEAQKIANEVQALYTNGPAGGGGATKSTQEVLSIESILIPRNDIEIEIIEKEVK
ncbi:MAG: DUF1446 domain-containing protein [Firmicutes bacterium]|nr:DUF1446 domain-containing protein [Bacillota bacterium]